MTDIELTGLVDMIREFRERAILVKEKRISMPTGEFSQLWNHVLYCDSLLANSSIVNRLINGRTSFFR